MSINNLAKTSNAEAQTAVVALPQSADLGLPTPAEIAKLASVYFPEFAATATVDSADWEAAGKETTAIADKVVTQQAGDFSSPFAGGRRPCLEAGQQIAAAGETEQFSFLTAARPIFASFVSSGDELQTAANYSPKAYVTNVSNVAGDLAAEAIDVQAVRRDFPILAERINGKPLIWLDNSATTQKPQQVIDRLAYFYAHENSNVHRAAHTLAARSTDAYEGARQIVADFVNASSAQEIIFVRGTTEAINLLAYSWGRTNLGPDDEIIISWLEHHANIVPWQILCAETGAKLRVIPVDDRGELILSEYERLLNPRTKLVSVAHVSNVLGTVTPVADIVQMGHRYGAKVLIDGAQAISHIKVDVQAMDCDFYVFSGHKVFAPTGIGAIYAKPELLQAMKPYQSGGNMIADVTFANTVYQKGPAKFEAGTGNIADAVGLGAALAYVNSWGIENIYRYEHRLLAYGSDLLRQIPGLKLLGNAREKTSVLSFTLAGFSSEEIGQALSREAIAVRAGHHCAQPILRRFGLETAVRPSLAFYNTYAEIDALVDVLWQLKR